MDLYGLAISFFKKTNQRLLNTHYGNCDQILKVF